MKKLMALPVFVLVCLGGFTQVNTASPAPAPFPKAMEAVLHDFTGNFRNISGDQILDQPQTENYISLVKLPGAELCVITRYHSIEDTTASWQARMYHGDDFQDVVKQYKELYNRLKSCYLRLQDGSSIYLKGQWEEPKEENKFTVSTFELGTTDLRYREMKIELEVLYQINEWVVNINVSNKKKDTLEDYTSGAGK